MTNIYQDIDDRICALEESVNSADIDTILKTLEVATSGYAKILHGLGSLAQVNTYLPQEIVKVDSGVLEKSLTPLIEVSSQALVNFLRDSLSKYRPSAVDEIVP